MKIQSDKTIDCKRCKNEQCFIKLCNNEWISIVNQRKIQTFLRKGQPVFLEGNPVFGAYFIQEGKVKISSSNLNGKKQIVRLANNGHILGHRGYSGETYPVEAITLQDSRICFFDNEILYQAFKANPEFSFRGMMFYSKELRKSELRAKYFAQMTIEEKVIFALLYIAATFGLTKKENALDVLLTRQEIAEIAGTNAEQVSRILTSLSKEKLIKTIDKKIIIADKERLTKVIARYRLSLL